MKHWLAGLTTFTCLALSCASMASTLPRGQDVAGSLLRGNAAAVWADMSPNMQAVLGSVDALTAVRRDLLRAFEREDDVLSERMVRQGSHDVYERVSRWTGSQTPFQLVVSFDGEGRIAGFLVRPQQAAAVSPHLDYRTKATLRLPVE